MPERFTVFFLALLLAATTATARPADESGAAYREATETILCDCGCHPQSVADCACGRAAEMRREMAGLVDQGMTGEQIVARYVAEHGEKIRIAPTATGFNLVAWLGPFVGLGTAVGVLLLVLRRWSRRQDEDDDTTAETDGHVRKAVANASPTPLDVETDGVYRERLRRALEGIDG